MGVSEGRCPQVSEVEGRCRQFSKEIMLEAGQNPSACSAGSFNEISIMSVGV